ncbi:UNVERIFIED_CONTAM: hypothetical protein GTU68_041403 [Idotea baltica]|nr:hypothetical protein [Idotea baltica]
MIQRLLWPLVRLGEILDNYERAKASAARVFGLIDSEVKIKDAEDAFRLEKFESEIRFKNLSFAYDPQIPILKDIDFNIAKGKRIGIAGPTGAGKSTLLKLILRLYEVAEGQILIDGHNIKAIEQETLRQQMAFVGQDVYLFHGSIKDNIAYSDQNLSLERVQRAAKQAMLHDFIISLPDQYDTIVGERGIKLSGGQRQRLSIARAIIKDAPILILDEATSAVDTETERAIQHNLNQLTSDKTALIIAHRLSTIKKCDQILVLDKGKIAEQGKHNELIEQKGIYADLWAIQTGDWKG